MYPNSYSLVGVTNSLSAPVAEEPGEVADAGADVDEAVAVGQFGGGREDVGDGGHADQLVLLLRLHVLPEHVPEAPLKMQQRNRQTTGLVISSGLDMGWVD